MTSTSSVLERELALHAHLRQRLAEQFPDADEDTLADTLDGLTTLSDQLAAIFRSALDDEALLDALKRRMADMRERAARLAQRAQTKRALVTETMTQAQLRRIACEDLTISLRPPQPGLVIVDEAEIPAQFWKPQRPRLDRQGLIDYLKDGGETLGACFGNGSPSITVWTR